MKSLAVDLDSGTVSRWINDPRPFPAWVDKYGDQYSLKIAVYRSGGGRVAPTSLKFLVKKPRRRDTEALWSLTGFSRAADFNTPGIAYYSAQVSVTGIVYRQALNLDASVGNDAPSASFLGVIQASTQSYITEVEFDYTLVNSGYRLTDANLSGIYVGISDTNGLLIRNIDSEEWRELVVTEDNDNPTFYLGDPVLGPVSEISSLSDDFVRVTNGILQIKNDDTGAWINVLLRGTDGTTISLGDTPPVGFSLSTNRYKVDLATGRLLLRNIITGNWHEARVTGSVTNELALGAETSDV
jgi:hypothetical protein